jgi:hypothetical protein
MNLTYVVLIVLAIVAVIVVGGLVTANRKSKKKMDVDLDVEKVSDAMSAWRRRQGDEHLRQSGVSLRCLNCNHIFIGPMPAAGCPNCHVASLVVESDGSPDAGGQAINIAIPAPVEDKNANNTEI